MSNPPPPASAQPLTPNLGWALSRLEAEGEGVEGWLRGLLIIGNRQEPSRAVPCGLTRGKTLVDSLIETSPIAYPPSRTKPDHHGR